MYAKESDPTNSCFRGHNDGEVQDNIGTDGKERTGSFRNPERPQEVELFDIVNDETNWLRELIIQGEKKLWNSIYVRELAPWTKVELDRGNAHKNYVACT